MSEKIIEIPPDICRIFPRKSAKKRCHFFFDSFLQMVIRRSGPSERDDGQHHAHGVDAHPLQREGAFKKSTQEERSSGGILEQNVPAFWGIEVALPGLL